MATEQGTRAPDFAAGPVFIPPLEQGDRLSRAEFERRYHAMPHLKKAELIEGVVYMPSPFRQKRHAGPHTDAIGWLHIYKSATPGIDTGDNATVRLDLDNEAQPDAILFIEPEHGGQVRISDDDYIENAPELVVEIASSSASYDLDPKLKVYRRNGVQEYIVWRVLDGELDWFSAKGSTTATSRPRTASSRARSSPASGSIRRPSSPDAMPMWPRPSRWASPARSMPSSSNGSAQRVPADGNAGDHTAPPRRIVAGAAAL